MSKPIKFTLSLGWGTLCNSIYPGGDSYWTLRTQYSDSPVVIPKYMAVAIVNAFDSEESTK